MFVKSANINSFIAHNQGKKNIMRISAYYVPLFRQKSKYNYNKKGFLQIKKQNRNFFLKAVPKTPTYQEKTLPSPLIQ